MKMTQKVFTSLLINLPLATFAVGQDVSPQFTSRVYFVIHESTPNQISRGRRMIERHFAEAFSGMPQLHGYRYQIVSNGNEVVISMASTDDVRAPFQKAVTETVGELSGQVRTRGRYDVLKTNWEEESPSSSLEVTLDKTNTRIRSISARAITLRDLLAELKLQFGDPTLGAAIYNGRIVAVKRPSRFSFMIPSDCAAQQLDWSFGNTEGETEKEAEAKAKSIEEAMQEIAKLFKLTLEKQQDTYTFSGDCPRVAAQQRRQGALEFLHSRWIPLADFPTPAAVPVVPRVVVPVAAPVIPVRAALE